MAIGTNDTIHKFGTLDLVTVSRTATDPSPVTTGSFSVAADISAWTNDEDAPYARFILLLEWLTTAPTDNTGSIDIYARPLNVQSTNESNTPTALNRQIYIGSFIIDWTVAATTQHFLTSGLCELPNFYTSQSYEFYIHNNAMGQSITGDSATVGWQMWIQPIAFGPKA
jgi:hypothetical protein